MHFYVVVDGIGRSTALIYTGRACKVANTVDITLSKPSYNRIFNHMAKYLRLQVYRVEPNGVFRREAYSPE